MDANQQNQEDQSQTIEVAGFIAKTFEILNDQQYSRIIHWSASGSEFVIKDISKFQQIVLPKFFRHNKINSFIRQLNMYDFHKSRKDHARSVFSHPLFLKNRDDLLPDIKRKIKLSEGQISLPLTTPIKQKISKDNIETATTGRTIAENKEIDVQSVKQLNYMDSFRSSFLHLFQSKDSKQFMNFSFDRISQNCMGDINKVQFNQRDDDQASIEQAIQEKEEREKQMHNLSNISSISNFLNPTRFFNSFISK